MELEDGITCISEPLSICKFLASNKLGFYGPDAISKAQVDQWIDIISLNVVHQSESLMKQIRGEQESDIRAFSQQLGAFRDSLASFDKHFLLRNYLVGYSLTLADVYLVAALVGPFKHLFDKKMRMAKLPNLTRFITLNLTSFHFEGGYGGQITLCKKSLTPPVNAAPKANA